MGSVTSAAPVWESSPASLEIPIDPGSRQLPQDGWSLKVFGEKGA